MLDDPYNFVDDDDSMQKPLQGQAMHPFTPNGYNMSQQSSQQHQSIDYSNPLATQSSAAPTPDKNVKKRGRKKKGDEIRYVCVKLLRHKCIRIYNITRTHTCTHTNVTGISFLEYNLFNFMTDSRPTTNTFSYLF